MIPDRSSGAPAPAILHVTRVLSEVFGLDGAVEPLPGERDHNYVVRRNGEAFGVLKFVHPEEPMAALEMQAALLQHLALIDASLPVPRVVAGKDGSTTPSVELDGRARQVRLVTWRAGTPLAASPRTPETLSDLGALLGRVSSALRGFGHPGAHRALAWDICRSAESQDRLTFLHGEQRELVARALGHFTRAAGGLAKLRHGVVHGDPNDWNVLVGPDGRISGLIDVGDAVFSPIIADLAIAAAYAAMTAAAPILAIADLVRGFHSSCPLTEDEAEILIDLVRGRLCTSLTIAAQRRKESTTQDDYWYVSEQPAWDLLTYLDAAPQCHLVGAIRRASGLGGARAAAAFSRWNGTVPRDLRPILGAPLSREKLHRISWTSPDDELVRATAAGDLATADALYHTIQGEQDFTVAVGSWGERRAVYTADAFRSRLLPGQRRDVHLGLDLFAAAGTPVSSPVRAVVMRPENCTRPQDYGGVVLLSHQLPSGEEYRSLWGHLDPASIAALSPGTSLEAGVPFARLGASDVNGGWVPHLHLQLVLSGEDQPAAVVGVGEQSLLDLWRDLYPDPATFAGVPPEVFSSSSVLTASAAERRHAYFGKNLRLSYREPLHIVRGSDVWLHDARGRAYLDCYNNVAHVGHCHPRVVEAIARQAAVLNTNTRYLHSTIGEYAERLIGTFPAPLDTCFFTNSGSEAIELALRIARTVTGRRDLVVLDWAYHGNTQSALDASPYKYKRAGGQGRPPFVHELPSPDPYRAPRDWPATEIGTRYAEHLHALILAGVEPAAFLAETIPSCAGQVVLPPSFLANCFESVRKSGGLCISDEVQVGFGRVGATMWAFQEHGVVPDIVTLGKPMGNGHPIGAVVTSRALAAEFANGMEYFNTFGGNPVSCSAGLAVLDALRDQHLPANASSMGATLQQALRGLQAEYESIGDVRGRGLFLGVELVVDRQTRQPATQLARAIADGCRQRGVLLGTDGPHDNVLKLRPPMTFATEHADLLLDTLAKAFRATR